MSRCQHNSGNIQQFTEVCLDCGHSIYETDSEYLESLQKEVRDLQKQIAAERVKDLEKVKSGLEEQLKRLKGEDDNNSGW